MLLDDLDSSHSSGLGAVQEDYQAQDMHLVRALVAIDRGLLWHDFLTARATLDRSLGALGTASSS
eukprot:1207125-Amphidinium_carterae.1